MTLWKYRSLLKSRLYGAACAAPVSVKRTLDITFAQVRFRQGADINTQIRRSNILAKSERSDTAQVFVSQRACERLQRIVSAKRLHLFQNGELTAVTEDQFYHN